jgi:hypothetical protein
MFSRDLSLGLSLVDHPVVGGEAEEESAARDSECSICLERHPALQTFPNPECRHQYCDTCIVEVLRTQGSPVCPQCRRPALALDGTLYVTASDRELAAERAERQPQNMAASDGEPAAEPAGQQLQSERASRCQRIGSWLGSSRWNSWGFISVVVGLVLVHRWYRERSFWLAALHPQQIPESDMEAIP